MSMDEDVVTQAIQVLSNFATLKMKAQTARTEALKIREKVDSLFTDEVVDEAELETLKEGFKVLKTFAQANVRYQEARAPAEEARTVIDQALGKSTVKPTSPSTPSKS
jgi:hypothetical protein